ncbi:transport permease protein [Saccharopolyspora subtropica]|uniref:Transport permease protein n=1 Tax=Saccharopolyspora thermophila TaxID=89367 RepID=A0A917JPV3_9PSEU|nr:ABC transporter permease [Saccharopolyspora subtropica]GGI80532.1 transport permease protein [Saccharopolyspora subtropica]
MTTTAGQQPDAALIAPSTERLVAVLGAGRRPPRPGALSNSLAFGWRAMLKIRHVPEQLIDATAFPIMLTLTFTYLFGGAIAGSSAAYLQYLLPGIMTTSVLLITMYTGVSLNTDMSKGVFDRFRTLSIWRPAPIVGYLLGDLVRYLITAVVIMVVGLILGFRPAGGLGGVAGGIALLLLFSFAFSWIWTMFGLLLRSEKSVMGVSTMLLFPLTFVSNVYVDPETMPSWLTVVVDVNPVAHLVSAIRAAVAGRWDGVEIAWVLASCVVLVAVFGTATMRLYNRK